MSGQAHPAPGRSQSPTQPPAATHAVSGPCRGKLRHCEFMHRSPDILDYLNYVYTLPCIDPEMAQIPIICLSSQKITVTISPQCSSLQ